MWREHSHDDQTTTRNVCVWVNECSSIQCIPNHTRITVCASDDNDSEPLERTG